MKFHSLYLNFKSKNYLIKSVEITMRFEKRQKINI